MKRIESMRYMLIVAALTITLMTCFTTPASAAPRVVVSIKPLHSLVSGIMKGVGEPYLLIKGAASPHTFSLKPSDARELERARVIFWVGDVLAPGLERPLEVLPKRAKVVAVAELKGLKLLQIREGGCGKGTTITARWARAITTTNISTERAKKPIITTSIKKQGPKMIITMITNTPRPKTITTMITNTRKPETTITTRRPGVTTGNIIITAALTRTSGSIR